jgi:Fe-S-cluster containining protein
MGRHERRAAEKRVRKPSHGASADIPKIMATISSAMASNVTELLAGGDPANVVKVAARSESVAQALYDRDPSKVACKPGCSWCCHERVSVSAPEVFRIVDALSGGPHAQAVLERAQRVEKATADAEPGDRPPIPCPLLEEGRCLVYAVRPLLCRAANATDATPCRTWVETGHRTPVEVVTGKALPCNAVRAGMIRAIHERGLEADPLDLAVALRVALEGEPSPIREAWARGERVFADAYLPEGTDPLHVMMQLTSPRVRLPVVKGGGA